jgi:hypothetical protein
MICLWRRLPHYTTEWEQRATPACRLLTAPYVVPPRRGPPPLSCPGSRRQARCEKAYFWNGARIFSISARAFFMPASGVYFSSRISWKVVTKMFRIFQLSWVLISGEA